MDKRPEGALMILRKVLQVSTNIRPVRMYPSLKCFSPLKAERLEQGMDVAFVRDIAGEFSALPKSREMGTAVGKLMNMSIIMKQL